VSLHPDIERLALLGWKLTPATSTKKGMFKGFIPAATDDLDQLEAWAGAYPHACWKVRPEGSGVWFFDVDVPGPEHANDGVAALRGLCELHGPLPPRPHARSPSGGHTLVFRDDGHAIAGASGHVAPGLDALRGKLCPMVPPSRRNGGAYRWIVAPWECNPPPAPEWLLKLLEPPPPPPRPSYPRRMTNDRAAVALDRVVRDLARAGAGGRNAALNRAAFIAGGFVASGLLDEGTAVAAIYSAARHIGLDDMECRATIRSGFRAGTAKPVGLNH
jgi:hypothetical protein